MTIPEISVTGMARRAVLSRLGRLNRDDISPRPEDPTAYAAWCEELSRDFDRRSAAIKNDPAVSLGGEIEDAMRPAMQRAWARGARTADALAEATVTDWQVLAVINKPGAAAVILRQLIGIVMKHDEEERELFGDLDTEAHWTIRAYLIAGAPRVCGPFGSYSVWSTLVRGPLVWLGEPDPVGSMDMTREEDPELGNIRELFSLWLDYDLGLDTPYTTRRIVEIACASPAHNDFNPAAFKQFLLRIAGDKDIVSAKRFGEWLRRISGRVVAGHRLIAGRQKDVAAFQLKKA